MGKIIGKNGCHFKAITEQTGSLYIYLQGNYIEIWAPDSTARMNATSLIRSRIDAVMQRAYNILPGYSHLPLDLRPTIVTRQVNQV